MKASKQKKYSVYGHKCPNGCIYVGSTSTAPSRRFDGGKGYTNNKLFAPLIGQYGWNGIDHRVFAKGLDKDTAKELENFLIALTDQQKTLNTFGTSDRITKTNGLNLERWYGLSQGAINWNATIDWYGNSINRNLCDCIQHGKLTDYANGTPTEQHEKSDKLTKSVENMKKKVKQKTAVAKIINGVRVELVLDTRYLHNNGEYPVCIRLYHNRKYRYVSIGYSMNVGEFSDMNPKDDEALRGIFNNYCEKVRNQTANGWFDLKSADFSASNANGTLAGLVAEKGALGKTESTRQNYKKVADWICKSFSDGLPLVAVNGENIGKLLKDMRGGGLSETSVAIYLSTLKAAINYGIYKGVLNKSQYPFKKAACEADKVEVPSGVKRDGWWLDKSEMQVLWNEFLRTKSRSLGYFLFSYLHGGANLADIMDLRFGDTWDREHGFGYVRTKTRAKNGFTVKVPATTLTDKLLETLGITPTNGNRVFPELAYKGETDYLKTKDVVSNRVNKALKTVSKRLGLSREISMTVARHTFASVAIREGFPFIMMDTAMGHAQTGVSSHYIGAFGISEMRPYFEKLL